MSNILPLAWALQQECESAADKLVLITLANHFNPDTEQCNPNIELLAKECCMSVRSVSRCIKSLQKSGHILSKIRRSKAGYRLTNAYEIPGAKLASNNTPYCPVTTCQFDGALETPNSETPNSEDKTLIGFDEFWDVVGKKVEKQKAIRAYKAAIRRGSTPERLRDGMASYVAWFDSTGSPRKYMKYPASWLNAGCVDDEYSGGDRQRTPEEFADFWAKIEAEALDNAG